MAAYFYITTKFNQDHGNIFVRANLTLDGALALADKECRERSHNYNEGEDFDIVVDIVAPDNINGSHIVRIINADDGTECEAYIITPTPICY